ncbi:MAG: hypothetical protein J1E16_04565 [Muribaculaceae bacterium]|nr:hypothetical protein [Muribaculaceae bacterium]
MKKTLLTLAAMAIAAGAWAQGRPEATMVPDSYIDVTPAYYKFYNGKADLDAMLRADLQLPAAFNLGNNNWLSTNTAGGENYFTNEQIANGNFLFGAFIMNNNKKAEFKAGTSLYDFGGNIGSALVINYQNSLLNEAIQESLKLDKAPEIPVVDVTVGGNVNFFGILDFNAMNDYLLLANPDLDASMLPNIPEEMEVTPIRIHVRLVLNAYNNDMDIDLADAFTFTYFQNEVGNTFGVTEPVDGSYVDLAQFAENGVWSPNGWLVRDYEFDYTGIAGAQKFQASSIQPWYNDGATLIRSIEVYVVPEDEESLPNIEGKNYSENYDSWWDSTKGSIDRPEVEAVALYIVGKNINGEEDWDKGEEMTYADGVYTWSGDVLGSGFKINNGTWAAEYNIGAASDASLELGKAFPVVAAEDSGNINFDGFDAVEDVTVVYDPKAMTVTVTGDAVVAPEPENIVLYVRGSMNEWGTTDEMEQDPQNENIYTYSFANLAAGAEFKIADADWGKYNYGGTAMEVYSDKPGVQTLVYNGGNLKVSNWAEVGAMELTFNLETLELTVVGPDQPKAPTVGVNSINAAEGEVEYYNLQGVKVANPDKGIYIIRQGNTTKKAVIR